VDTSRDVYDRLSPLLIFERTDREESLNQEVGSIVRTIDYSCLVSISLLLMAQEIPNDLLASC